MRLALCSLLFLVPALALAQDPPTIKLPTGVKTPAGKLGKLRAETTGKYVEWIAPAGLDIDPSDNGRTLYYTGLPGTYELLAYTALGDVPSKAVRTTVTIGEGSPGPGPVPPTPPIPPPQPVDALKAKIKAAFEAAAGSPEQKVEWARDLAALYRSAKKTCADPKVTTTTQLKEQLKAAATFLIGEGALVEVRQVVALELAAILSTATADITAEQRELTAALFTRLAAILEGM